MASKNTGLHPIDADFTRGRAEAIADADAVARRMDGLERRISLTPTAAKEPKT